jgi:hypothetical protein
MAFFARFHAVILLAIISMVTASLINSMFPTLPMYACVIEGADTHSCPDLDALEELHVVSTEGDTVYGRMSASCIWWTDMLTIPIQSIISLASLLVSLLVTSVSSLAKSSGCGRVC